MNERIKELAEQAGIEVFKVNGRDVFYFDAGWALDEIERFAELVRQDEREACAKLCWKYMENTTVLTSNPPKSTAAFQILQHIEARSNHD